MKKALGDVSRDKYSIRLHLMLYLSQDTPSCAYFYSIIVDQYVSMSTHFEVFIPFKPLSNTPYPINRTHFTDSHGNNFYCHLYSIMCICINFMNSCVFDYFIQNSNTITIQVMLKLAT